MHKINKFMITKVVLVFLITLSISCVPVKKLRYFNDIDEMQEPVVNPKEHKLIGPFDKLYVKVLSIDEKTNQLFNSNDIASGYSSTSIISYLVDESGEIFYPIIGKINVGGLTTAEASLKVEEALNEYVPNASVVIKFIDNNVTVMGEVQRQGVYPFTQDKMNIYEAIALGGGLTRYGNRKNVILIRQEGDKIVHHRLDLTNSEIAGKNYYYVNANDVIIVEPIKSISSSYGNNTYSLFLASITALISVLIFLKVNQTF